MYIFHIISIYYYVHIYSIYIYYVYIIYNLPTAGQISLDSFQRFQDPIDTLLYYIFIYI